jgi:hypothetical protein
MAVAVIDLTTGEQVNLIVADVSEPPPAGCELVDMPAGFMWSQERRSTIEIPIPDIDLPAAVSGGGT